MAAKRGTKRRATLAGWWRGVPFVIVPFAVLFSEAWFRTGILTNHYRLNELTVEMRDVQARIQELRVEESHLTRLSRIDSAAPDLGLIPPSPGQVVVIELRPGWRDDVDEGAGFTPGSVAEAD